jgi:hypothetical protein
VQTDSKIGLTEAQAMEAIHLIREQLLKDKWRQSPENPFQHARRTNEADLWFGKGTTISFRSHILGACKIDGLWFSFHTWKFLVDESTVHLGIHVTFQATYFQFCKYWITF